MSIRAKAWKSLVTLAAGALFSGYVSTAGADAVSDYPSKPVTIVFPFAAGSGTDATIRLLADYLSTKFKQQFVVDNRAGAGGAIGGAYVAKAAPDGYTLEVTTPGPGANYLNTYPNLPYNPLTDFEFVSLMTVNEMVIVARAGLEANNLKELAELAKKNPGKISAGNPGVGTYGHMAQLTYADTAGITFTYVPYKGSAPIVTDLLSGSVDIAMDYHGSTYQEQVKAGKIKILGFATSKRNEENPNVPTFVEQGVDFTAQPWAGVVAPKGTPEGIVKKLNEAINEWLKMPDVQARIRTNGAIGKGSTPAEFKQIVIDEEKKWRATIKKYDIKNG